VASLANVMADKVTWYPPVKHTLSCLAMLYRCVEERTFAGLAHEAVQLCIEAIQIASRVVSQKYGIVDGQLFAIKHLLILREQMASFDSDLAVFVKELDFSHMRGQMRRMLSGELSVFSITPDNALFILASKGAPRVVESTLDSKDELEQQLKAVCEAYIMSITKQIVEPMLSFITKVTAMRVSSAQNQMPIRETAFAAPDKLAEIVRRVSISVRKDLPQAAAKMCTYLNSSSTQEIIFKPIQSNIAEAHGQIAMLLETEYELEDVERIQLMDPCTLSKCMDSLVDSNS